MITRYANLLHPSHHRHAHTVSLGILADQRKNKKSALTGKGLRLLRETPS
jgi:hypothetical protein